MAERLKRAAQLRDVPIEKMRTREEISQRALDPKWVAQIAQNFELEDFGAPVVNKSGEWFWIVDGQHRIAALKQWLGEWHGQKVECWVYDSLSEKDEANLFDQLNTTKAVSAFDKFRVRLTAEREEETNVAAIVRLNGLNISRRREGCSISCVTTLLKVYRRGADCLDRDLKIVYQAFGDGGLDADILDGIGLLVSRYNGRLDDDRAIRALSSVRGGANALRSRAEKLRQQMGAQKAHCIAAAAVETYNKARGSNLPGWWKTDA